jgi:Domain of unknown function (DUF4397)
MPRLVEVLSFAVAIVGIAAFAASCGSNSGQFRVFNAIASSPDNPIGSAFDIWINGGLVFSNAQFESTQPNTGYKSITSGSDTLELFQTGTTTNPYINSPLNLAAEIAYTVVLTGNSTTNFAAHVFTDTNTVPTSGNANFRIIDASLNAVGTSGVDIYILPPGTTPNTPGTTPVVTGLTFGNASPYNGVSTGGSLTVYVTVKGSRTQIAQYPLSGLTGGTSIRTMIITDSAGASYPPLLWPLTDVQ